MIDNVVLWVVQVMNEHHSDAIHQQPPSLTGQDLAAMPYTTAIVKEVLRHRGIVATVWRKALVDLEVCGYRIPKVRTHARTPTPDWFGHVGRSGICQQTRPCLI